MDVTTTDHQAAHSDREMPVDLAALRQIGDAVMARADRSPVDAHLAAADRQQPGDSAKERRFAGAVGADQRHARADRHVQRDAGQHIALIVAGVKVAHCQRRLTGDRAGFMSARIGQGE